MNNIVLGGNKCYPVPAAHEILARMTELAEYHGRTLPLPLVFDVLAEFGIEKTEAKIVLRQMEKQGYFHMTRIGSAITLMPLKSEFSCGESAGGCYHYQRR